MAETKDNTLSIIALVALVAVVGMVVAFAVATKTSTPLSTQIYKTNTETKTANSAGQASNNEIGMESIPVVINTTPNGIVSYKPTSMEAITNIEGVCRYSLSPNDNFNDMYPFNQVSSNQRFHSVNFADIPANVEYVYYVKCRPLEYFGVTSPAYRIAFTYVPTTDTTPPTIVSAYPQGPQPATNPPTSMSVTTYESVTCKYSLSSTDNFDNMYAFPTRTEAWAPENGGSTKFIYSVNFAALNTGYQYTYFAKCKDEAGNVNPTGYEISFIVN